MLVNHKLKKVNLKSNCFDMVRATKSTNRIFLKICSRYRTILLKLLPSSLKPSLALTTMIYKDKFTELTEHTNLNFNRIEALIQGRSKCITHFFWSLHFHWLVTTSNQRFRVFPINSRRPQEVTSLKLFAETHKNRKSALPVILTTGNAQHNHLPWHFQI